MRVKEWDRRARSRPNKVAQGMQYTWERHKATTKRGGSLSEDATTLCVRGTLAQGHALWLYRVHTLCKCCGSKTGPYVLNDSGRKRLARLRRRAETVI